MRFRRGPEQAIFGDDFDQAKSIHCKSCGKTYGKHSVTLLALYSPGLVGLVGIVGYNMYHLRRRPKDMKMSVYLIHTRVAAQGFVVSCLTAGVCYQMYKDHLKPKLAEWQQNGN